MQDKYSKQIAYVDSVSIFISTARVTYGDMLVKLSDNLWLKGQVGDSLWTIFNSGVLSREMYLLDNYKKQVVDSRSGIKPMKEQYTKDLASEIFGLTDSISSAGMAIFLAMEKRDAKMLEAGQLLNVLVNESIINKDSLKEFMKYYDDVIQENICWITGGSSKLKAVVEGYKWMLLRQKYIEDAIHRESHAEFERYRMINKEIIRRKIKYGSIPPNNMRVMSGRRSLVKAYKRDYLKKLKDERRKEREKAKKKGKTI
jgi:hypothetical protein